MPKRALLLLKIKSFSTLRSLRLLLTLLTPSSMNDAVSGEDTIFVSALFWNLFQNWTAFLSTLFPLNSPPAAQGSLHCFLFFFFLFIIWFCRAMQNNQLSSLSASLFSNLGNLRLLWVLTSLFYLHFEDSSTDPLNGVYDKSAKDTRLSGVQTAKCELQYGRLY